MYAKQERGGAALVRTCRAHFVQKRKRNIQWKTIWIEYFGGDTYFRLCFPVRFLDSTLQKYILYLNIAILIRQNGTFYR